MVLILVPLERQDKEPLGECATAKYNFFISEFVYLQKNNAPKTWLSYNVFLTSPCRLVEGILSISDCTNRVNADQLRQTWMF